MRGQVAAFVSRRWRVPAGALHIELQPVPGGLESRVARARISTRGPQGAVPRELLIKELPAGREHEADVYDVLWRHLRRPPAARILGREITRERTYLYLEAVRSSGSWPWAETRLAGRVCHALAGFHDSAALPRRSFAWDYEAELARSAGSTLDAAGETRDASGRRCWRRLGDLRRIVSELSRIRARLLSCTTVIHGDVHPGNVILRPARRGPEVVLVDWGRARLGSPLEDVASWLHSVGCWEPEARRRHDTLMRAYLTARRCVRPFTADLRADYWLASASNGLAGAIRYHCAVLSDGEATESARYDSRRALAAWERVVRRAAALLSTSRDR